MSEEIFILARGRGKVLFQNGFEYYHHVTYRTNQNSLWRCMNYKTKKYYGTITINQSKDQVIKFKEHSVFCLPNVNKSEINKIITKTFENAHIEETIPAVYKSAVLTCKDKGLHLLEDLPSYSNVKSVMYRKRRKRAGVNKMAFTAAEDVVIPPDYENLILADFKDNKTRIIIFCTEDGRNIIKTGKAFLSDGTFKKCPKPFVQLYVIFCDVGSSEDNNKVVPVLYALLTDKKKTTYSIMLEMIKKQIPEWTPSNFVTDFVEQATISAIKEIFPEIHHHGCYYHFREKLRRKAKKCGLTDSNSKKIVGLCSTLPLLPASKIHEGWKYIQNEIILDNPKLKIFMNYFKTFWMPKSNTWSCFGNRHRTTNTCEGWNAHYNGSFKKRPTTLFAFLKVIKNDSDFRTIVPKIQEKRKSSVLRRNSYIHHVQMQLTVGDIDVPLFLEKLRQ